MVMIPKDLVDDIKERTDIVNLIESYMPLNKKGRNYWGLCPFHLEDTPSFSVSGDKQMFYCFGCHKGGNAISFVMEYENISFPEAVRKLGERAGIPVPEEEMSSAQKKYYSERRRLIAVNEKAIEYFQQELKKSPQCTDYLANRGVSQEMIEKFSLGYAPDSWEGLKTYLKKQGIGDLDMIKSGVVSKSDNGRIFDRFRDRLMFPIFDAKGNAIAFVGRLIKDGDMAKYVNTEGTSIYHKGSTLYALNHAVPVIRNLDEAILMEGNLDVVSAHQFGVENSIAPQGTALTEEQAQTIRRYCRKIYLAYDSDKAGAKAALKNMDILIRHGFRVYVMEMPPGLDPDDVFHKRGIEAWQTIKQNALPYMAYKIKMALENYDITTAEGKADAVAQLGPSLMALRDNVERSDYIHQIAEKLQIDENLLHLDMQRRGSHQSQELGRGLNLGESVDKGLSAAKEYLLRCAIENKEIFDDIEAAEGWSFLDKPGHKAIIDLIKENYQDYSWEFRDLPDLASEDLKPLILSLALNDSPLMVTDNPAMFRDSRRRVRKDILERELKEVTAGLDEAEKANNYQNEERLLRKFDEIQKELREL